MPSLSRDIGGAILTFEGTVALHRTLGGVSNLTVQCCRAWASAKVSSFLFSQKSLVPENHSGAGSPSDTTLEDCMGPPTSLTPSPQQLAAGRMQPATGQVAAPWQHGAHAQTLDGWA